MNQESWEVEDARTIAFEEEGIKVAVIQPNHQVLAEFGVFALSFVMLVQTMLCDNFVGDLEYVAHWWTCEISPTLVLVPGAVFNGMVEMK